MSRSVDRDRDIRWKHGVEARRMFDFSLQLRCLHKPQNLIA